jgi:predicted phosphodiesterase
MEKICVVSDAHLLYQAEWIEDEKILRDEAKEVLDNFERAVKKVAEESPVAVILVGDIFDTKAVSGQRVAYREAEKYMLRIRQILNELADRTGCKIYALRGNHDSEPVLRGLESVMNGNFLYAKNQTIKIGEMRIALMDTHYLTGTYEISATDVPDKADFLFIHESVPILHVLSPPAETFVEICKKFKKVFNGHMHFYSEKVLGIPNFYLLPAFIPSREIKNSWMLKFRYANEKVETEKHESPFGYLVLKEKDFEFKRYNPLQIIVRVELIGKDANDFIQGIQQVYDLLAGREDKQKLRVWIRTNADKITVDRVLWERVTQYSEIKTMDIECEKGESLRSPVPTIEKEFGDVAFTRTELTEKVLQTLKGKQLEMARSLLQEVFSPQVLESRSTKEIEVFKELLEIISKNQKVSSTFAQRAWELFKRA